jgi:hypothetical protein
MYILPTPVMSKDIMSFWCYISTHTDENIQLFKAMFADEIDNLPNKVVTSKILRTYLMIDCPAKQKAFQNVFLDYFRLKIQSEP